MLHIVEAACEFSEDKSRGTVVIESDQTGPPFDAAFAELTGQGAVQMAQAYAATLGCAPARLNGNRTSPYPINHRGLPLEQVRGDKGQSLAQTHPDMQPARYRVDVPVARPVI